MVGVGRDLCGSPSPTPCRSRVTYSRQHRTLSRWVLNISREGCNSSSAALGGERALASQGLRLLACGLTRCSHPCSPGWQPDTRRPRLWDASWQDCPFPSPALPPLPRARMSAAICGHRRVPTVALCRAAILGREGLAVEPEQISCLLLSPATSGNPGLLTSGKLSHVKTSPAGMGRRLARQHRRVDPGPPF